VEKLAVVRRREDQTAPCHEKNEILVLENFLNGPKNDSVRNWLAERKSRLMLKLRVAHQLKMMFL
jgi:hypothetical protein